MSKTSIALQKIKGGVKVFANAVPKDEVKPKETIQEVKQVKLKEPVQELKTIELVKEVQIQSRDKPETVDSIQPVQQKIKPVVVVEETTPEELLNSLKSESVKIVNSKKNNGKISIVTPDKSNMNTTISEMYEKLGSSTQITGYDEGIQRNTFDDMKLDPRILKAIYGNMKWEYPSPIQAVGTMPLIEGRDVLCQAQAGTGKTATYMIPALQMINPAINGCQVIILSPTRELSEQTFNIGVQLAIHTDISIASHIGGNITRDKRGVTYEHNIRPNEKDEYEVGFYKENIVIATPGRLLMLLKKGYIKSDDIKLVILDEADNILSYGFMDDIGKIFRQVPENIQVALYSATLAPEIIELSVKFMMNPVQILVHKQENIMTDNQTQYTVQVADDRDKLEILSDIFSTGTNTGQTIIFCNKKYTVNDIYKHIKSLGLQVGCINSEMEQSKREESMRRFREGKDKVLIGTDVIARGIDTDVNTVVNFDIPNIPTQFVHRCGRTGRFGKHGNVINIVNKEERDKLARIIHRYNIKPFEFSRFMKRSSINI